MSIELLYPQVTEAIRRAERLEQDEPTEAAAAHLEVSRLEEKIARLLPADDEEGAIARRGAVSAAVLGGDVARARELVERFSCEPAASAELRADLERSIGSHALLAAAKAEHGGSGE